jgi:hypothetical protein
MAATFSVIMQWFQEPIEQVVDQILDVKGVWPSALLVRILVPWLLASHSLQIPQNWNAGLLQKPWLSFFLLSYIGILLGMVSNDCSSSARNAMLDSIGTCR